jgi:hypothetical protein
MQRNQIRLLPFIFVLISLINTAFIINNKNNSSINSSINSVETPPQYKVPKMTFFEHIIVKRMLKKLKSTQEVDLDAAVKDAKRIIRISLILLIGAAILFFIIPIMSISALLASPVFAIIGIKRAESIIDNPTVTGIQEKEAKSTKTDGYCGLIMAAILIGLVILIIKFFLHSA